MSDTVDQAVEESHHEDGSSQSSSILSKTQQNSGSTSEKARPSLEDVPRGQRRSYLPRQGLEKSGFAWEIPANHDAKHTAEKKHGHGHWKVKVLNFIHSKPVEYTMMGLLLLDVLILFTELFLAATYPLCNVIERDAISCCPPSGYYNDNYTALAAAEDDHHLLRLLESGNDHHGEDHHSLCDAPSIESYEFEATCDPHKYATVHKVEAVLFWMTVTILSLFMVELLVQAWILQCDFFRQAFYVLDLFVVATSLTLEVTFAILHDELLATLTGIIVFARLWRFVRIGHGLVEVCAEVMHEDQEALLKYAEKLEKVLNERDIALPEPSKKVRRVRKAMERERHCKEVVPDSVFGISKLFGKK